MKSPTPRQLTVLRAIRAHQVSKGFPISIRDLCVALNVTSTNSAADHLRALEKKGLVRREKRLSRTLQLTAAGHREIAHGG